MRALIYLTCLVAAYFGGGALVGTLAFPLVHLFGASNVMLFLVQKVLGILAAIVSVLVLYRILVFIKSRSILIPENFRGIPFAIACVATIPALAMLAGYAYFIFIQKQGISGIPLAFGLAGTALLSVIPVIHCELKEFYSMIPKQKP